MAVKFNIQVNGMTMEPLVSVVIPAFNRAHTIEAAVKSVQEQTYRNWEIIVSDDGSTDETQSVVERLSKNDPRVHYVKHHPNRGAQSARNNGIRATKGEWVAFLDSDDQWLPDSLKMRMDPALSKGCSVVYSNGYILFEDKRQELYQVSDISKDPYKGVLSKEGPMFPTLIVKKDALEKIGYLDETAIAYQEWNTSIRLAKFCAFCFVKEPTFIYDYRTPGAISRSHARNAKAYVDIVNIFYWEMFKHVGTEGLVYHYERISDWYRQANDSVNAQKYKMRASMYKAISLGMYVRKLKSLLRFKG